TNEFKEGLIYTHHLANFKSLKYKKDSGKLLSCGIVKVTPLGSYNYGSIAEANYYTNTMTTKGGKCNSGFEGKTTTNNGKNFYTMKVDVCAEDAEEKPFVKMEVISVAYDNQAKYLNEYITHPLQVKAMKNLKTREGGLVAVRKQFLDYVSTTKLGIVGYFGGRLEQKIFKKKNSTSFHINSLFAGLVPQAHARLDVSDMDAIEPGEMVMYENLPYRKLCKNCITSATRNGYRRQAKKRNPVKSIGRNIFKM
ncbi:hypothetical protein KGV52_00235, partial [Candidatus Gracilibacteria bacterium]|nr:hypothetical protein [Candidatus Gracilibacteria bacterium]